MKIAIVGFGFVGKALSRGLKKEVKIIKIDPILGTNISDLKSFNPKFIFVCVPTPMNKDGSQDLSIVEQIFSELSDIKLDANIVLKSSVIPSNLKLLNSKINYVYNPEFLREKHAEDDFINGNIILFGGEEKLCLDASKFYSKYTLCKQKEHFVTDKTTASLVKYSINSFLATKVIFFNQLKSLLQIANPESDWEKFIDIMSRDVRVGDSHMQVPGHDGREGFGGACFPKDISALEDFGASNNFNFSLIKEVIKINNQIRSVYNDPTQRESEQNITFSGND